MHDKKNEILLLGLSILLFIVGSSYASILNVCIFFALVPLIILITNKNTFSSYTKVYIALSIANYFNLIWISSVILEAEYIALVLIFSLLQCIPFIAFRISNHVGKYLFISSWLILEILLLESQLMFPMSLLGLRLTKYPQIIQWFEYTGILGGTFWILVSNVIIANLLKGKTTIRDATIGVLVIITPILLSFFAKANCDAEYISGIEVGLIHTDYACPAPKYTEDPTIITEDLIRSGVILSEQMFDELNPRLFIYPETALTSSKHSEYLNDKDILKIRNALTKNANDHVLMGGVLNNFNYELEHYNNSYQMKSISGNSYLMENVVFDITKHTNSYRVKELLVPFNEYVPYHGIISYKPASGPYMFSSKSNEVVIDINGNLFAPFICYESFCGSFVADYVNDQNIDVIVIGLNEGWYNTKKGFELSYGMSVARAIENRSSVLRSSNCGYTSYLDIYGEKTESKMDINKSIVIDSIMVAKAKTLYTKYSNRIECLFVALPLMMCLMTFFYKRISYCNKVKSI